MNSKLRDSNQPIGDGLKDGSALLPFESGRKPLMAPNLLRRVRQTTWWIYCECGDPEALGLLEQVKKPRDGIENIGQRLELALPEWCRANHTRKELCAVIEAQFKNQPETAQTAVDEIRLRVKT